MATPEQTKERIAERVRDYNAAVTATREDLTLSPLGRRRRLEELYDAARDEVSRLRSTLDTDVHGDRRELERRLFGLPRGADASDAVSYRDATDRVAAVRNAEALGELMERAASSGDDMLLRAGFARAWQESRKPLSSDTWSGLVGEYADQAGPSVRRDIEALERLSTARGATAGMLERMATSVRRPAELDKNEDAYSDATPARPGRQPTVVRGV